MISFIYYKDIDNSMLVDDWVIIQFIGFVN